MRPSFHVRVTVYRVEGGDVCLGRHTCMHFARFTVLGVMQGPHASPVIMVCAPEVFLSFKRLHKSIVLLAVILLGGLFFHAHLSCDFFFVVSFVFFCSFVFLATGFFSFVAVLLDLLAIPLHSFFNELISAVMATIFSCSSVGLPQVFSSSRSQASYLFSARTMRSSAV